jgi:hypothetical protein
LPGKKACSGNAHEKRTTQGALEVSNDWSGSTDWATVCKRNAGRRHFNSVRNFQRAHRRKQVVELLVRYGMIDHGVKARIARELGVHKCTITRDVKYLLEATRPCPRCGSLIPMEAPV